MGFPTFYLACQTLRCLGSQQCSTQISVPESGMIYHINLKRNDNPKPQETNLTRITTLNQPQNDNPKPNKNKLTRITTLNQPNNDREKIPMELRNAKCHR